MNSLIWLLLRRWIYLRRGRLPPADFDGPVWYFAFGSNMNERLFRARRHMTWLDRRVGRLDGYRLAFTVAGGRRPGISAPANIITAPGEAVYGVLYRLPLRKFARLDNSEGKHYTYLWCEVEDETGARLKALTYRVPVVAKEGQPSRTYLDLLRQGAHASGLPSDYLAMLDRVAPRQDKTTKPVD